MADEMNYLKDFEELNYQTTEAFLEFDLGKTETLVTSTYKVERVGDEGARLFFDGEKMDFVSVAINDVFLKEADYKVSDKGLEVLALPKEKTFEITFKNKINPSENSDLEGLYVSGGILCTQNEPMGFRRITYSIDRPDNMVKVQTKIWGDKKDFPFMLSNGNLISHGEEAGKTFCLWEDPFAKPLYLFALVAGDLAEVKDSYTTGSGKEVEIRFYCDHGAEKKCDFAIQALKDSMKWDEERFNLEYDLNLYMVVAVDSFNMGAMENKGLNIFNSALVLANPSTATDLDYHRIQSVIGHEYFHNWTGNRVTLKNWFQLTLKEGLTVFRDQEFSADLNDRAVERIDMVKILKQRQFVEDAGPLAHPIRPEQYKEMNNFYTATVYDKGAEIIRIFHTLLGEEKFQKAMKKYFELYDGKAITTEDFISVMCEQDARLDESYIKRWYQTPGTPHVDIEESYVDGKLNLKFKQTNKVAVQKKIGFNETYIPVKMSIYNEAGEKVKLQASGQDFLNEGLVVLKNKEESVVFEGVSEGCQVSYFEDFSAPITYSVKSASRDIGKLIKIDQNHFNKYNAFKQSALDFISGKDWGHIESFKLVLKDPSMSFLMKSHILAAPSFQDLIEGAEKINPSLVLAARKKYLKDVGEALGQEILSFLKENPVKAYAYNLEDKGLRALRTALMTYVLSTDKHKTEGEALLAEAYEGSDNMTTAFSCLVQSQAFGTRGSDQISSDFYTKNKDQVLTLQKWITAYMSTSSFEEAQKRLKEVEALEGYDKKIPNFVRALWGGFYRNSEVFHDESGRGYALLLEAIEDIDKINPQMASGLMKVFDFAGRLEGACAEAVISHLDSFNKKRSQFSSGLGETFDSIYGALKS